MTGPDAVRWAVYTRKSSDEGLEQSFNSLHAQREACEAFIKSQAGEGWLVQRDRYDDGGYSGGGMDRPGLRRLLSDVAARRVDVVVVYKVDRLTRSLRDFAKIIETLDAVGASFVSVTQAFNTTSSMGRLTLNVLLSFAQFEREVTCERIRDKIAASKAKGMWMGGVLPLGYDPPTSQVSRALSVNQAEAKTVRLIFRRYLELGNTLALQRWLESEGIRSKSRAPIGRRREPGHAFSRGALGHLLKNRTYVGEIPHKLESYPGRHPAIVDRPTFEAAQALLARNSRTRRERVPRSASVLLRGILFDGDGQPMDPVFARGPHGRCYQYYVSAPIWPGRRHGTEDDAIRRVTATAIEDLVLRRLAPIVGVVQTDLSAPELRALLARVEIHPAAVHVVLRATGVGVQSHQRIGLDSVRRQLLPGEQVTAEPQDSRLFRIMLPVRLKLRGGRIWVVDPSGGSGRSIVPPDRDLIRRLRAAHTVLKASRIQPDASNDQMRYARAPTGSNKIKLARWAFLAPDLQEAILAGRALGGRPSVPTTVEIPLLWADQRTLFGVPQPKRSPAAALVAKSLDAALVSPTPTDRLVESP
ncbi:MAG: recombinase family protein [Caulobacterales bacterium]